MTIKNLLIGGLFGLTLMGPTQGTPEQIPVSGENTMKVAHSCDMFGRCHKHKRHHKHHKHHKWHHHPYGLYKQPYGGFHPNARARANYCKFHPYSQGCERFCYMNKCFF
jgi:hypothetical protein